MVDVGAWLHGLGLGQYEPTFRDAAIDGEVLSLLSGEHLKELGIPLGHRLRMLKATSSLGGPAPTAGPLATTPVPAERRQLTVMFVDLVGSTALASRLDPEEMGELLRTYRSAVAGAIARFGGHTAKFLGDGILAYFGWPKAHEDAAERAVRAALALVAATTTLAAPDGSPLAVRVGLATGLVVVGDLIGDDSVWEGAVIGGTPNLAARLQALTEAGQVVIAEGTRQLLGGLFDFEDLGPQTLKGLDVAARAFRVTGERSGVGRFEARQSPGRALPMVGRNQELAFLREQWRLAATGAGRGVLLVGEAGVGKSRLARALLEGLADEPCTRLVFHCSPLHVDSALWPFTQQLAAEAGLVAGETAAASLDKLETLLRRTAGEPGEAVALLADLLGIDATARHPALDLLPQQRRARTLGVLADRLLGLAARGPVLVQFEDVHWIDPTSLRLVRDVLARIEGPMLVLLTSRPEGQPALEAQPRLARLALGRLGDDDVEAMVARLAGGRPLPPDLLAQIMGRTDGMPLFVEEVTKAVLEAGLLRERDGRYELDDPLPPLAIPASLQDTLVARLDRLAPVKEVAQLAACLGREFDHATLAAVSPLSEPDLTEALDQLVAAELIERYGSTSEARYSFKHALVRDAAYVTLLKSRRQLLHARIAASLEQHCPEIVLGQPEVLATHWAEAGLNGNAIAYCHRAGKLAIGRAAMAEAIAQLQRGLALVTLLPDDAPRARHELDLLADLSFALMASRGVAAAETGAAYTRTRELCRELRNEDLMRAALWGMWQFLLNRAELAKATTIAGELLAWAGSRGDGAALTLGHRCAAATLLFRGELAAALARFEEMLVSHASLQRHEVENTLNSKQLFVSMSPLILLLQGSPERARARSREALAAARQERDTYFLALAMHHQNLLDQVRGDRRSVEERTTALKALTAEHGFAHWHATATALHGWAIGSGGEVEAGIEAMERGFAAKQATGSRIKLPYYLGLMADLHGRAGRAGTALSLLDDALGRVERTGEGWFAAELHRLKGEVLLRDGPANAPRAETCFRTAIDLARHQNARWWELRAATSLARLWAKRDADANAYTLLAPIFGWFSEGFDTPTLREAAAVLDMLRPILAQGASAVAA